MSAPATLGELLTASGEAARAIAGAEQSAWSGLIVGSSGSMLGLAHWDGTLYLDNECILDPLRHLYDHAGETHPASTLIAYRESLATLLHEQAHFLGPAGATQDEAREQFTKIGSRELEEGVTEAWAQDHLDDYLRRLGIDKVAPGIDSVRSNGYYPAFVPAVRELTTALEVRNNLPAGQALVDLNRQTAAGQFSHLVDLVYNSSKLPDLEPPGVDSRPRLESILRTGLAHLDAFELNPADLAASKSRTAAHDLLTHLDQEIQLTESAYTFQPVRAAVPAAVHTAFSGVTPASPSTASTSASTAVACATHRPPREFSRC